MLSFEGCPNWQATDTLLERLSGELSFDLDRRTIDDPEQADRLAFSGSPSVLMDGRDVFASDDKPVGLSCRVYATDTGLAGAPSEQQLRDALTAAHR